ncbi:MAG TPA: VWA domain-containing protein [Candidatus Dormibacteraeota bacterium]|nr:VWA domain-containing protein [Candidatus Dormibacteraeota bacterium]
MSFLVPLAGLTLLALPAILLLYFLKVRRPHLQVSSLLFWRPHLSDRQANAPWQRLRPSLLLFLQLLAAALLGLALTRPGLVGAAGVSSTTVVILDASPSMEATDVAPSRFQAAVARAKQMAGQLGPGQQMAIILLGPHPELLAPPTGDPAVLRAALDRARPAGARGDFGEGISLANAILSGRPGGSIVMLSDGHSLPPPTPPRALAPLTYESIGSTGENVAIQSISRTANGTIFLELANYGREARSLQVDMVADGHLVDVLPVHLDGNTTTDLTWSHLPAGTRVLEARLTPGDDFPLDDRAWLLTAPPPPHRALLVTSQNVFLQRALQLWPGLQLTTEKPADYQPGHYDLYVFDGWLPPGGIPQPALIVNPPAGLGPVPVGGQIDPGEVLPGNPQDRILQDVDLQDVHVQSAGVVRTVPAGWRTVIAAAADPLLLVREGGLPGAVLTFDLHHSDLPLRAAFPILVQNLLQYLMPGGFENQVFPLGQPVSLQVEPGVRSVQVVTPDGRTVTLASPSTPFTDTTQPGVYTVRQRLAGGTRVSRFVVQLQDPTISRIAPGAAPLVQAASQPPGPAPRGTLEIWPWLAMAALLALVLEWLAYLGVPTRRLVAWGRWRRRLGARA